MLHSKLTSNRPWMLAIAALMLGIVACTCGPLTNLTGEAQATLEAAQVEAEVIATDVAAQAEAAAQQAQEAAEDAQANQPDTGQPAAGEVSQFAFEVMNFSSQYGSDSWSAQQALGEPDTFECGDFTTAWASDSPNGPETLTLRFEEPVVPTQINIYESYNPGAITQVIVIQPDGVETVVFNSTPNVVEACPRVLTIDVVGVTGAVDQVRIDLDETEHPSWNEIDAVQLNGLSIE